MIARNLRLPPASRPIRFETMGAKMAGVEAGGKMEALLNCSGRALVIFLASARRSAECSEVLVPPIKLAYFTDMHDHSAGNRCKYGAGKCNAKSRSEYDNCLLIDVLKSLDYNIKYNIDQ